MYIFTPNTLIKSAEINANFAQVTNLENPPYAYGTVNESNGEGVIALTQTAGSGITFNGTNTYTVVTKGIYFIHAQQLTVTGDAAIYFHIQINGSTLKYGYMDARHISDLIVSAMSELNVGDTIRLYRQNTANTCYGGQHSAYQIFLKKRT